MKTTTDKTTVESAGAAVADLESRKAALHDAEAATAGKIADAQARLDGGDLEAIPELALLKSQAQSITDALSATASKIEAKSQELAATEAAAHREQLWTELSTLRAQQSEARAALNAEIVRMDAFFQKALAEISESYSTMNTAKQNLCNALGMDAVALSIETQRREASGQIARLTPYAEAGPVGAHLSVTHSHNAMKEAERFEREQRHEGMRAAADRERQREERERARIDAARAERAQEAQEREERSSRYESAIAAATVARRF